MFAMLQYVSGDVSPHHRNSALHINMTHTIEDYCPDYKRCVNRFSGGATTLEGGGNCVMMEDALKELYDGLNWTSPREGQ